jgi:ATP-dependent helicase/nuclease subunit B
MDIELVVGEAGSGKTRYCVNRYVEYLGRGGADTLLFLLPTGEAVHRGLEEILGAVKTGLFAPRVFTFRRLLEFILGDTDRTAVISKATKEMLLERILSELAGEGKLEYLKPVALYRGAPGLIGNFIAELKLGGIGAKDFSERIRGRGFHRKDREIALIYRLYERRLHECGLSDEQDLYLLSSNLLDGEGWKGTEFSLLLVDGFHGFTPVQLRILERLAQRCEKAIFTLEYNPERQGPFSSVRGTYEAIRSLGATKERVLTSHAGRSALSFLQGNIFTRDRFDREPPQGDDSVRLIVGGSSYREVEAIAMEIKRLLKSGDATPEDICVLFRSASHYAPLLQEVFGKFGVPLRMVRGEPIGQNPLVRVFRAVLEIAAGNWNSTDLLRVLKSSYIRMEEGCASFLETVSRAMNVVGGFEDWMVKIDLYIEREKNGSPQEGDPADTYWKVRLARLRGARQALCDLHRALGRLPGTSSVTGFSTAAKGIIRDLGLGTRAFSVAEEGVALLRRDLMALERLEGCLDEMARADGAVSYGGKGISLEEFLRMLDLELSEVMYHYDERRGRGVAVMDVHGARPLNFLYVFVGGLIERVFPHPPLQDPLYRDEEREKINRRCSVKLEKHGMRLQAERHLFYTAISRARRRLYLSYAKSDELGREILPSYYIDELKRLFVPGSFKKIEAGLSEVIHHAEGIWNREDLLTYLLYEGAGKGGRPTPAKSGCLESLGKSFRKAERRLFNNAIRAAGVERVRNYVRTITKYDGYLEDPRVRKAIRREIGPRSRFNVTMLNMYGRCPFAYFLKYTLRLRPLEEPADELTPLDRGAMLHRILYDFFTTLRKKRVRVAEMGYQDAFTIMADAAGAVFAEFERAMGEAVPPLWKLQKEEMLQQLCGLLEAEAEWEADPLSSADPFVTRDGIHLCGRIDRVDLSPDGHYLVIDYKLGEGFDWRKAQEGIDLQIPVYIQAAGKLLRSLGVEEAVGGCYFSMKDFSMRKGMWRREYNGRYYRLPARYASLIDMHTWEGVMEAVHEHIKDYVRRIRRGDYRLLSRLCPTYCEFSHICRFDEWRMSMKEGPA